MDFSISSKIISVHGRDWIVPEGNNEGQFRFMSHEIFNLKVYDVTLCPIEKGFVVIDVGANVGMFTTYCCEKEVEKVYAIEPGETYHCLIKNTKKYKNVNYTNAAAWSHRASLEFIDRPDESGQSQVKQGMSDYFPIKVEGVTIDYIVKKLNLSKVDFIKIDVEGSEIEVLDGAKYTIKTFKPRMAVCLYHKKEDWELIPKLVFDMIHSYKYTPISYRETRCDVGYFY